MKFLFAKLFGKKRIYISGNFVIIYYCWRGKIYVTKMSEWGQE